uniref:Uncharacterized protein n=1 Tax=Theropithecus gelada TaxID=9565 RepID=A0A8D2GJC4_THEGE
MSGGSVDYNSREHGGPQRMDPDGVIESNWKEVVDNFDDTNLKESLLWGICAYDLRKQNSISKTKQNQKYPKVISGTWRLYGSNMSCLHWWNRCSK